MDFVLRGKLPLKQCKSYMDERPGLRSARRKVFSLHDSVIGAGCAKRNPIAFVVRPHPSEVGTADDSPFEMEDVGGIQLRVCWLMMITELIQPRQRVRIRTAIERSVF